MSKQINTYFATKAVDVWACFMLRLFLIVAKVIDPCEVPSSSTSLPSSISAVIARFVKSKSCDSLDVNQTTSLVFKIFTFVFVPSGRIVLEPPKIFPYKTRFVFGHTMAPFSNIYLAKTSLEQQRAGHNQMSKTP